MKNKLAISLVLGIAFSAGTLYFAFKNVPLQELIGYMGTINYIWIVPSTVLVVSSFALRAYRWQIILSPSRPVNFWRAFHPLMIGFMLNCVLPGRVGEIARPIILYRQASVPFSSGLATVAAERIFDIFALIVFFSVTIWLVQIDPNIDIAFGSYHLNRDLLLSLGGGVAKAGLVLIFGIMAIYSAPVRGILNKGVMYLPRLFTFMGQQTTARIEQRICRPIVTILNNFATGFDLIQYPRHIVSCMILTILIWGLASLSYYLMAKGCPGIRISFLEMSAVMIIICFFIALPSVPGYWGIWEAGGVFALMVFGTSKTDAAGFTLASHVVQILPVVLIGLVSASLTGANIWQVRNAVALEIPDKSIDDVPADRSETGP